MADDHAPVQDTFGLGFTTHKAAESGFSETAITWRPLVEPGMYVVGVAGDEIGQVKEVRAGDFLIDRSGGFGMAPDSLVYLPFERIHAMMADRITLDIPGSQVDDCGTEPGPAI